MSLKNKIEIIDCCGEYELLCFRKKFFFKEYIIRCTYKKNLDYNPYFVIKYSVSSSFMYQWSFHSV